MENIDLHKCNCSRERFEKGLISLGKDVLIELIEEDGQIETVCKFCNKKYIFNKEYIEEMIKELEE